MCGVKDGGLLCGTSIVSIESIGSITSIETIETVESSDSIESVEFSDCLEYIEPIQSIGPIESIVLVRADFRKMRFSIPGSVMLMQMFVVFGYVQASGPL